MLLALGVRKHVELQLVFTRLLGQDGGWSHVDVVRYLVSVKESLAPNELERLKKTAWILKEGEAKVPQQAGPDGVAKKPKTARYPAEQLFEVSLLPRHDSRARLTVQHSPPTLIARLDFLSSTGRAHSTNGGRPRTRVS